jgi:quinohemoprotein ethanol dehydrogenase
MQAPKNGFFYVLDRATGELLSADAYVPMTWATGVDKKTGRPIERPEARYKEQLTIVKPGPFGGHNWQPMSFSPQTGLVYIPAQDPFFAYAGVKDFKYRPGAWNTGSDFGQLKVLPPVVPTGHLLAWDPVAQKERWRVPYKTIWNGGLLSTAGNLVFQGTADGRFVAYSADRGEKLWEVTVGTGIIAAPVTYEVDGVQYVSVMAGWGGAAAASFWSARPNRNVRGYAIALIWRCAIGSRTANLRKPTSGRAAGRLNISRRHATGCASGLRRAAFASSPSSTGSSAASISRAIPCRAFTSSGAQAVA